MQSRKAQNYLKLPLNMGLLSPTGLHLSTRGSNQTDMPVRYKMSFQSSDTINNLGVDKRITEI